MIENVDITNTSTDTNTVNTRLGKLQDKVNETVDGVNEVCALAASSDDLFEDAATRDTFFNNSISLASPLKTSKAIMVTEGAVIKYQIWGGAEISDPANYVNTNWVDSGNIALTAAQIAAMYHSVANEYTAAEKSEVAKISARSVTLVNNVAVSNGQEVAFSNSAVSDFAYILIEIIKADTKNYTTTVRSYARDKVQLGGKDYNLQSSSIISGETGILTVIGLKF